jgi:hypothetical protein
LPIMPSKDWDSSEPLVAVESPARFGPGADEDCSMLPFSWAEARFATVAGGVSRGSSSRGQVDGWSCA